METLIKPIEGAKLLAATQTQESGQTIVHCKVPDVEAIRIWKSTYLVQNTGTKAALLFVDGVAVAPEWSLVSTSSGNAYFTLIFESLDKDTDTFYLDEIIPEPYAFYSNEMKRTKTDVYEVELLTKN